MSYKTLILFFAGFMTSAAFAATPVFQGSLSRSYCVDHGGAFDQGSCGSRVFLGNRGCTVRQQTNQDGSLSSLKVEIPGRVIRVRLSGAYLYSSQGIAYTATIDRETSLEVMTDLKNGLVTKVNIYADHVQTQKGNRITRSYTEYSCRHLRLVR